MVGPGLGGWKSKSAGLGLGWDISDMLWFGLVWRMDGERRLFERVVFLDHGAAGCVPGWRWERTGHGML